MRIRSKTALLFASGLSLLPATANAHTVGTAIHGWNDGFAHPLHGWDHLLAMIAIGLWAGQHRGRGAWVIPATFVSVMLLGSVAGLGGVPVPGVEALVAFSVVALGWLVLRRVVLRPGWGACLAGFFCVLPRLRARRRSSRGHQRADLWRGLPGRDGAVARGRMDDGANSFNGCRVLLRRDDRDRPVRPDGGPW